MSVYNQDIPADPSIEAKLITILREKFNITGIQAVNQQFLEEFLKANNMTREDFLASVDDVSTQSTTLSVNTGGDSGASISWGIIIPIILIAVFLVCVASCLYWHSWRDKNKRSSQHSVDRSVNTSFERFSRMTGRTPTRVDYVRGSSRSIKPLNVKDRVNVVPLTSENPGEFKFYWDKDNWKLCPPDGSIPLGALSGSRSSLLRQHLSPIDELESPALYTGSRRSYAVGAQPPFSPYHLTWVTPKAPPPSYEESELSSPDKSQRITMSNYTTDTNTLSGSTGYSKTTINNSCSGCTGYSKNNTTNNTGSGCTGYSKNNTTNNTCSGYTGYSKNSTTNNTCSGYTGYSKNSTTNNTCSGYTVYSMKNKNSPFYPNNNTPTTDFEFASELSSLPPKASMMTDVNGTSNVNSRFTSYPSTPLSSSAGSVTEVDTVEEVSYRNSQYNNSHNRNSFYNSDYNRDGQHNQETDHNRNSITSNRHARDSQYSNMEIDYTRDSQYEEEYSMGIPSLPSSILYYHQKMTTDNVVMSGKVPRFSPHGIYSSQASSLESSDTCYTDNTSMLPCVGSSITSGNPTGAGLSSLQQTNSITNSVSQPGETTHNLSPEDLSKIVDELSSIRPASNEPPSVNHGVVNSMCGFDGTVGQSYVADIYPPQSGRTDSNIHQNITELFRSWSVTAELNYSSGGSKGGTSMQTPLHDGSFSWDTYPMKKDISKNKSGMNSQIENVFTDVNHNVISINNLPAPGRNVQFAVPVLVDKTYWV